MEVILAVQIVAGIVLLAEGNRADSWLHYMYGSVFPGIVIGVGQLLARDMAAEADRWKVMSWASIIAFLLVGRALMTGLGLG